MLWTFQSRWSLSVCILYFLPDRELLEGRMYFIFIFVPEMSSTVSSTWQKLCSTVEWTVVAYGLIAYLLLFASWLVLRNLEWSPLCFHPHMQAAVLSRWAQPRPSPSLASGSENCVFLGMVMTCGPWFPSPIWHMSLRKPPLYIFTSNLNWNIGFSWASRPGRNYIRPPGSQTFRHRWERSRWLSRVPSLWFTLRILGLASIFTGSSPL